jgi:3-oxoadipate enol-lactonase
MPYAYVNGTHLHLEERGRGEPMLWITGFAISGAVFEPVLHLYAERLHCVSYDNRGAGRSSPRYAPTSIPELAGDAVGLLDHLGIDSAHVYGLSMGGMVAQEVAIRFPDRVRGLVLGGTSPGGPRAAVPVREVLGLVRAARGRQARARIAAQAIFTEEFQREHPERVREVLDHLARHRTGVAGLSAHWWASFWHDTYSRLPRIAAPTLVMHGGADGMVPLRSAQILAERIPDAELAVVPGAGHGYLLEQPELSRDLLVDWLDRRGPIPAGPPPSPLEATAEPVTRALGLPLGVYRTGVSLTGLLAERLGLPSPPDPTVPPGTRRTGGPPPGTPSG